MYFQSTKMNSKFYGPPPKSFTLEDGERYYVGADVGMYLKYNRGTLYKRYPQLWKRMATIDEKKIIQDMGCAVSYVTSNIMLVKANEVEDIFEGQEEKYRSGGGGGGMTQNSLSNISSSINNRVESASALKSRGSASWLSQQVNFLQ